MWINRRLQKIYRQVDEMQKDLDIWLDEYNKDRTHQGKICCGRTPMQTFLDGKTIARQKTDDLNLAS